MAKKQSAKHSKSSSSTKASTYSRDAKQYKEQSVKQNKRGCGCKTCLGCLVFLLILVLLAVGATFTYLKWNEYKASQIPIVQYDTETNVALFENYLAQEPEFEELLGYYYTIRPREDQQVIWETEGLLQDKLVTWDAIYIKNTDQGALLLAQSNFNPNKDYANEEISEANIPYSIILTNSDLTEDNTTTGEKIQIIGTIVSPGSTADGNKKSWIIEAEATKNMGQSAT